MPTKRALIIGINTYLHMEEQYQLKGCENDARLMHSVLVNKFNFAPENIILLLNEEATLAAIHAAMANIEQALEQDDIFVFHFSGHGGDCTVHEAFSDEATGKDNCILPCDDSEPDADGKPIYREVRDEQFSDYLSKIAKKTVYTTLIFDACYSGTMTRSSALQEPAKARFIPPQKRQAITTQRALDQNLSTQMIEKGAGGWLRRSDTYTVISASRDTQKAKEWHFDIGGGTVRHGLLSFFLARSLMRAKPLSTYRDIFESVSAGVVSMVTQQNPQIEGVIDREVFGVKEVEALDFVPVTKVEANVLTMGGGTAQGLRVGNTYKVYPPGTKVAHPDEYQALIQIVSIAGLSAQAEVLEQRAAIEVAARCVLFKAVKHADLFSVNVNELAQQYQQPMRDSLNQSKLVAAVDSAKGAQLTLYVCETQAKLADYLQDDAIVHLNEEQHSSLSFPLYLAVDQEGNLAMRPRALNEPDALNIIMTNLEKLAKFRNVMQLNNSDSKLDVAFDLYRLNDEHNKELVNGGSSEFAEHELMAIELSNKAATHSVFFAIFWIGADKEIMHFYPRNRNSEELAAGKTLRIGNLQSKLAASLPKHHFSDLGSITWKVMFASSETEFGLLSQSGMRSSGNNASLEAFDIAFTGEAAPSHSEHEDGQPVIEQDWCAINRSVVLNRTLKNRTER